MEEARQLARETEGWITGILLGTHTLWKGLIRSITAAKARDEQVFDYMAQEIFNQQPDEIKRFLKGTSILNVMTPTICDRLLGIPNSDQLLDTLEQDNLFVLRLSGDERTYRYHALFQDFLRGQFDTDGLEEMAALHRKAGKLRLEEDRWEAALEHFIASGSDEDAIEVIKGQMEAIYRQGRLATLKRWLDAIAPSKLSEDPILLIMRGRLYRQVGDFESALACYEQARTLYLDLGEEKGALGLRIHEALVHQYSGAMEKAREMAETALEAAGEDGLEPVMSAQAYRILGEYHHLAGELEQSKREYRLSLNLYERAGDHYHQSVLLQALGTTARRMGNSLEAEEHYSKALDILNTLGNRWRMAELQNNIGMGYYYQGEYEEAHEIFEQALKDAREVGHLHTEAIVLISLGDLYADLSEVGEAQAYFQAGLEGARTTKDVFLEVYCLCSLANLYRVDEAWEHARSLLEQAGGLSGEEGSGYLQGLVALARGMVSHDQGELHDASEALQDAIDKLTRAGAQRELTRAHLWYAVTSHRMDRFERAYAQLGAAIGLAHEIKHPHLLVVDASQMGDFLRRARAETDIEGLDSMMTRIQEFESRTRPEVTETVAPVPTHPEVEVVTLSPRGGGGYSGRR
jgi:ATP/maltotriose-dependent transcriptional regulator MalT